MAVLALALDWWLGEPRRWHPLVGFGAYAQALERWLHGPGEAEGGRAASERGRGALAMSLAVLPPVALCAALSRVPMIGTVLIVLVLYAVVGHRSRYEHAHAVQESPQDSLAAMSLVVAIEEKFRVQLSTKEIMKMSTIGLARKTLQTKKVMI